MLDQASAEIKTCGEPVSKRATRPQREAAVDPLCALIRVVKEASSTVMMPSKRRGSCSGMKDGVGADVGNVVRYNGVNVGAREGGCRGGKGARLGRTSKVWALVGRVC